MSNYNQSFNTATIDYCFGIAKLLTLLVNKYTTSQLNNLLLNDRLRDPTSTLIDIHPILVKQVAKGQGMSNKLIGTPSGSTNLLYKLERSLGRTAHFKKHDELVTCQINNIELDFDLDITRDAYWEYVYAYFLRLGYTVVEEKGIKYNVIEPLGKIHSIDKYACSCDFYTRGKKCIHLQLIDWYKQSKLLTNYEYYQRTKLNL